MLNRRRSILRNRKDPLLLVESEKRSGNKNNGNTGNTSLNSCHCHSNLLRGKNRRDVEQMMAPKVAAEQGIAIDRYFECSVKQNAAYVECTKCGAVHDVSEFTSESLSKWKFDLMGLIPSRFFKTIRGICPTCQEMWGLFRGIAEK